MSEKVAPTAPEALAVATEQFIDKETVVFVQRALLSKGYVDGGPPDGNFSQKTKDEILTFRARNNLQLIPVIDKELLKALETAPQKSLPVEQVTATTTQVAQRVEVVAKAGEVKRISYWAQFWAWFTGIPAGLFTVLAAIISQLDDAIAAIQPLKAFFSDASFIPTWGWFAIILAIALIFAIQQMRIATLAKQLEQAGVEGYQRGTIKNDLPPKEEV